MKYSRLSIEDLKDLEKEFINFLVINGIIAEDWEKLKEDSPEKAEEIINQFSDVIWESILTNSEMVEFRSKETLTLIRFQENKMTTLVVKSNDSNQDLRNEKEIEKLLANIDVQKVKIHEEVFRKPKNEQLFQFVRLGFYLTKEKKYLDLFQKYKN